MSIRESRETTALLAGVNLLAGVDDASGNSSRSGESREDSVLAPE